MGTKGTRQKRLCKFDCGREVKQNNSTGRFKGYYKTCGICPPKKWTEAAKSKIRKTLEKRHSTRLPIGSRRKTWKGKWYWEIKVKGQKRWKLEHRHILEQETGKRLPKKTHVHHIDGNGLNNKRENLIALSASKHAATHNNHRKRKNGRY